MKKLNPISCRILLVVFILAVFLSQVAAESSVTRGGTSAASPGAISGTSAQQPPSCLNPQQCREIDEVWFSRIGNVVRRSIDIWDVISTRWKSFNEVYPSLQPPTRTGILSSNLIGPSFWCTGNEGLPNTEMQAQLKRVSWNSGGKTYEQLATNIGTQNSIHPALLATHMYLESRIGQSNSCTESDQKSSLTGCRWTSSNCADISGPDVISDEAQVQCSATKTYVRNGALGGRAYEKCDAYQNNPNQQWKCIFCVYQGSYDHVIGDGSTYFTRDGTCQYAENFKEQYCKWVNYFTQQSLITPPLVQPAPVSSPFRFVVISDYHEGDRHKNVLVSSIISLSPKVVMINGDTINANTGTYQADWDKFFTEIVTPLKNAGIPVIHVLGNHDYESKLEAEQYYNQRWREFYQNNAALYGAFSTFDYSTQPYLYFDYAGRRFIIMRATDTSVSTAQVQWVERIIQPGSFLFSHVPLANVQGPVCTSGDEQRDTCDYYRELYVKGDAQIRLLQALQNTHSISFGGHLHYYYKTNYRGLGGGLNVPLVFVPNAEAQDNRGILKTYNNPTVQPPGFVVVDVGATTSVNEYLLDGDSFRVFGIGDESKYWPSSPELAQLGEASEFSTFTIG